MRVNLSKNEPGVFEKKKSIPVINIFERILWARKYIYKQ